MAEISFINWGQCDVCGHWTHLKLCSQVKILCSFLQIIQISFAAYNNFIKKNVNRYGAKLTHYLTCKFICSIFVFLVYSNFILYITYFVSGCFKLYKYIKVIKMYYLTSRQTDMVNMNLSFTLVFHNIAFSFPYKKYFNL